MAEDNKLGLKIDGTSYNIDIDNLELGELEMLEQAAGASLDNIDFNSARAMVALVYLVKHKEDASYTLDDARRTKLSAIDAADEPAANGNGKTASRRPTKAAKSG